MPIVKCIICLAVAVFLMMGCASNISSHSSKLSLNNRAHTSTSLEVFPSNNLQKIALYQQGDPPPARPYKIIGTGVVSKYNLLGMKRENNTLHTLLQRLAASAGGDAVINVQHDDKTVKGNIITFQRILL